MQLRLLFILLLVPFIISAQTKKSKRKEQYDISSYYAAQQLSIDSARTPYLFYQVYDWLGTRYKYSGDSKKGIDCSGFVSEMYEKVYCIHLSGGSRDIWATVQPIEKGQLSEGDLLFFKIKMGGISHVGIYLGNNKFAHASVRSGVTISDLNEAYYKRYFYKGGRIR
jgi:lipoprotein Spr